MPGYRDIFAARLSKLSCPVHGGAGGAGGGIGAGGVIGWQREVAEY